MTDEKSPAPPADFEMCLARIEAVRGQLGDAFTGTLIAGARQLYERIKSSADDDPLLERSEAIFLACMLGAAAEQASGQGFFDDLKNNHRALEITQKVDRVISEPSERKGSTILALMFELFLVVHQARVGLDIPLYLQALEPFLDGLRGCGFEDQQLDALAQKIKGELGGLLEH